ncbi:GLPGLI family protein [Gelidibacter japonicus]|uniref:GLPGLI family protein n=1 Tax=Gelidibacter japonicus TaxID=1962232 RepID=UPI0013D0827E|nr:GLPGLI family protein [Gelidibacter japonicus]
MTKIKALLLFLTFSFLSTQAQQDSLTIFQIEYRRALTPQNSAKTIHSSYLLQVFIESHVSVFDKLHVSDNTESIKNDEDDEAVFYYTPKGENYNLIYKDYASNQLFSKQDVAYKYFIIEDSLSIFDWQIYDETKDILGYTCQLAKTSFRGRSYIAWFTSKLPIGGPWKYDGLPGMILSLEEEDSFLTYEAISIKSKKTKFTTIKNPLTTNKTITWQEFKDIYKQKAIDLSRYNTDSNGTGRIIMERRGIERYIEENDMDYLADKEFKQQQGNN